MKMLSHQEKLQTVESALDHGAYHTVQHCEMSGGLSSWQALSLRELVPSKSTLSGHSVHGRPLEREG